MQQISDQEIPYDRRWGQDRRLKLRHMLVSFSGADDIETAMEIAIGEIIASRKLRWSEAEYQRWAKMMLWIYQDDPKLKEALGQEETR